MAARVSVIVPIYNAERYIRRCVDSVIGQTYSNIEIILVDDCSADNSAAICMGYARLDKRVRVIIRGENAGPAAARVIGVRAAASDYITFLDADDWFDPAFVEKILGAMLETESDIGLCDIYYAYCSPN